MFTFRTLAILAVSALLGMGVALQAHAYTYVGQKYERQANISLEQARNIAQKQVPGGRFLSQELEREKGGSGLRYSFDIKVKGVVHEVGVDAKTGKVLENSVEGRQDK